VTEIKFFFNVENRLALACKLCKSALEQKKKLVVYVPEDAVALEFDRLLWGMYPLSFIPHVRAEHAYAKVTPVIFANAQSELPHHAALLNLSRETPPYFTRFEQLREIVTTDENDRAAARERLKFYKSRGFEVTIQDMAPVAS
jgi:DNA polymerase-3 subunit chi